MEECVDFLVRLLQGANAINHFQLATIQQKQSERCMHAMRSVCKTLQAVCLRYNNANRYSVCQKNIITGIWNCLTVISVISIKYK